MMNNYLGDSPLTIIKLELDGSKLKSKYKIKPFSYKTINAGYLDESKEQVQTNLIKPIFPYIKRIILIKSRIDNLLKQYGKTPSNYITTTGTRNGTICSIIEKIKKLALNNGFDLYVQSGSKIEKNDTYIEKLLNYPLIDIEVKYAIVHRGFIKNKGYGYNDILIDGDKEIKDFVVGKKINIISKLYDKEDLPKDNKSLYKDDNEFKPYILKLQKVEDYWILKDMIPL